LEGFLVFFSDLKKLQFNSINVVVQTVFVEQ